MSSVVREPPLLGEHATRSPSHVLAEIQALRALAVTAVVLFHFWPRWLPGGFVGVDVFFVISGFLITGQIVRSLDRGTFTFRSFYSRRARRLLPAAALVLAASVVVVLVLLPYSRWHDTMREALASLFYVQNWVLALGGSDYFAGDATAAQHYWSLSVEEQFYLIWPAALVGMVWWQGRRGGLGSRRPLLLGIGLLSGLSLVASIVVTFLAPTVGYFATYTRIWEFGVGGVLALLPRWTRGPGWRVAASWAGIAAIVASTLLLDEGTLFPGWIALLPVLGTGAVIAAGLVERSWSPARLARMQPVQWLGDVSYSVYLWHWPLIILLPEVTPLEPKAPVKVALLLTCLVLAGLTKILVEDRLRAPAPARDPLRVRRGRRSAAIVVAIVASTAVLAGAGSYHVLSRSAAADAVLEQARAEQPQCFGASALADPGCTPPYGGSVVPDPGTALHQFTSSFAHEECFVDVTSDGVLSCLFGAADAGTHVVLLGDSHALHWLPALEEAAQEEGWKITTYLRGSCPANPAVTFRPDPHEQELCARWSAEVLDQVTHDRLVDLVVTTASRNKVWVAGDEAGDGFEAAVKGYVAAWQRMVDSGKSVLVLKDTPRPRGGILECVAEHQARACGVDRDVATASGFARQVDRDPLVVAAHRMNDPQVTLLDPTDVICGPERCEAVVGNVLVFVDESHLSTAYARTLAPFIRDAVVAALR